MSAPNPGSAEARKQGCSCPVLDNNNGKRAPYPPDGWWMSAECPMHGPMLNFETVIVPDE